MSIKNKLHFTYNGRESEDLGIANVNVDSGLLDETFLPSKIINEIKVKGRTKPYFIDKTYNPLILNLSFAFLKPWDEDLMKEVVQTFNVDYYKPLWFQDVEDSIFYCMYDGDARLIHNGLQQGYIEIQLRCNDICAYSREKTSIHEDSFDSISFRNRGNLPIYPTIKFIKDGQGDISIKNTTNNKELIIVDLEDDEEITINNEYDYITSDIPSTYRYNNHNNIFMKMEIGKNDIEATGIKYIEFIWRFKTLQI